MENMKPMAIQLPEETILPQRQVCYATLFWEVFGG